MYFYDWFFLHRFGFVCYYSRSFIIIPIIAMAVLVRFVFPGLNIRDRWRRQPEPTTGHQALPPKIRPNPHRDTALVWWKVDDIAIVSRDDIGPEAVPRLQTVKGGTPTASGRWTLSAGR